MNATARFVCIFSLLLAVLLPGFAFADHPVGVSQGKSGNTGRLVFQFPEAEAFRYHRAGEILTLKFNQEFSIATVAFDVPGLVSMQASAGTVRLQLEKGAKSRVYRLGTQVVVDATPQGGDPRPGNVSPQPMAALGHPKVLPPAAAKTVMKVAGPMSAGGAAPVAQSGIVARGVVDFATQPGAAAFRRGGQAIIVFDTGEVADLSTLQSVPVFAGATLLSQQDAQIISIPLPVGESLALTPVSGGWQIAAAPATPIIPAPPQNTLAAVDFPMLSANQSVIAKDPLTGGNLLVGTVTQKGDAADYMTSGPGYVVLPAWLGVVIVPQADDLGLNASLKGFELVSDAPAGLPLGVLPPPQANAPTATGFGQSETLPRGTTADLWNRMVTDQRAAAMLPPLGRLAAQITLAQDLLALGMGPEATGVLNTAVLENPAALDNGQIAAMHAVANVLSHRSNPADFSAPGIVSGPELAFWRAVAMVEQGQTRQASPGLVAGLPLFQAYPEPLRDTVTAEIAEALADAGSVQAARQWVDADPGNRLLDLARAKILEDQGQAKAALAAYQTLTHSDDARVSALANARTVELHLAAGQLNEAQAADALDAQLFDWRAPEHERHMRLRIAQLRAASGQWIQAFAMLQSAHALFPGHRQEIDAVRSAMFLQMLGGGGFNALPPIEAVSVLQQNQDLIPLNSASAQVISLLAQRLDELDLPGAAAPILGRLIQAIPPGPAQASLGATLAQVDLDAGSPVAALADLSQTQADGLSPGLAAQRQMLAATAQAAGGNAIAAVNILAPAALPGLAPVPVNGQALAAQAQIAEQSGQWPQAEQALNALVAQSVPAAGTLALDKENLLLRLATAASHNNDSAGLAMLSSQYGGRVGQDAAGQMFQTLTAPPLTGDQGLNQALHEIAQLQALPEIVNEISNPPPGHAGAANPGQ